MEWWLTKGRFLKYSIKGIKIINFNINIINEEIMFIFYISNCH